MKILPVIIFSFLLFSCSIFEFGYFYITDGSSNRGKLEGRVFKSKYTKYEIGPLPEGWKRIDIKGGDIAFWNKALGGTITVDSTCEKNLGSDPEALAENLLAGVTDRELIEKRNLGVDGEEAFEGVYTGRIGKFPIKVGAIVLRKGNCVYDLTYASAPDNFQQGVNIFRDFVLGFKVLPK